MAASLNSKRVFLMAIAVAGLVAALACIVVLAAGLREPTRERLFLTGSILIVSLGCLALSVRFRDDAIRLEEGVRETAGAGGDAAAPDPDDMPLPQNGPAVGARRDG